MSLNLLGSHLHARHMHVLVSSMSARGRAIRVGPDVVRRLRAGGWKVTVSVTTPDDDPRVMAAQSDAPYIAGLGGDGYLSAVAQGVTEGGGVFVPLPGGRGNDLCRALKVGPDPAARAASLAELGLVTPDGPGSEEEFASRISRIDGMWVAADGHEPRLVLGVVSMGVDARANELANNSWFRSGPIAYGYGAFGALTTYRPIGFRATIDGQETDLSGWLASIANSGFIGGGVNITPTSDIADGWMDVLHVGGASMREAIPVLTGVIAKRSLDHPLVSVVRAKEVHVTAPVGHTAWADGDPVARVPFTVRMAESVVPTLM